MRHTTRDGNEVGVHGIVDVGALEGGDGGVEQRVDRPLDVGDGAHIGQNATRSGQFVCRQFGPYDRTQRVAECGIVRVGAGQSEREKCCPLTCDEIVARRLAGSDRITEHTEKVVLQLERDAEIVADRT